MSTELTPIIMRMVDPKDGLILRFKNDLGGRDLMHFPGNYALFYENETVTTVEMNVTDFRSDTGARGRESVLRLRSQDKIQCSRFVKIENKEAAKQLLSSRFVELYTGKKNDAPLQRDQNWLNVKIRLRGWSERAKENYVFLSIEITLPERYTDEA